MNSNNLVVFIGTYSIKVSGLLNLFNYENAMKAIAIAKQCDINVLGIDAFKITGDSIQPSLDNSIDFYDEPNTFKQATEFIESRKYTDYYYEIVFDM